ncbi:MAG: BamA/TamA family outer membrane protein [Thermodesulfobacteriota bacterium]
MQPSYQRFGPGRPFLVLSLMLLALLGTAAGGAEDNPAAPHLILRSLKITGNRIISSEKIKDELTLPLPSRWPWIAPPPFRPQELEGDLERLPVFFRTQGFYHTHIVPTIHQDEAGQVDVVLDITEGPWVMVEKLDLEVPVASLEPELTELKAKSPLRLGERFTEKGYEELKNLYLNYLLDHGYPRGKIAGKVLLDEELNTARIFLKIEPGPLCYFGEVTIRGDLQTPDYIILRKLTFKKGEPFSYNALYDSQKRLYALDLFSSVTLSPQEVPPGEHSIPVAIDLQEKKKRSLKLGLGYGTEDEFRARVGLRLRNLGGGGRLLDLDAKYSSLESRVMGTFTNPQLWATRNDLVFQSGLVRRYLPGFTDRSVFTQTRLERDLPWHLRGYVGHGLEFARPFNIPLDTLLLLKETQTGRLYRTSKALLGLRQDTTDNPVYPHRGGILSAVGEAAPDFFGSNLQYARTLLEARRYQSLGATDYILAGRVKLGMMEPMQATSDIPILYRFFCGGPDSVRGYRLDYLGPRNLGGFPIGGNALLEGSLEARVPIYKEFHAVGFLDFGNVYLKIRDLDVGQLKYASGFGLRYNTPIGPLGVDVGFPLNPIDPQRDKYQINLTIGQSF